MVELVGQDIISTGRRNKKMKVMIIGLDPTPATASGVGDLSKRLIEQSKFLDSVSHICRSLKPLEPVKLTRNATTYPVTPPLKVLYPLYAFKQASKILKASRADAVYTQDPFLCGLTGYMIKKFFGVPLIIGVHADFIDNPYWLAESTKYPFLNLLGKILLKRADSIRLVSSDMKEVLIKLGIDGNKIIVRPTGGGVSFERFSRAKGDRIKQKFKGKRILLFVGRLVKQKNLDLLLTAVKELKLKDVLFLIVGDGPERERLEQMAKNNANVRFLGIVPFKELPDYYAASDLTLLSSNYEGLPKAVEESLAAGTPVVSTRVSGSIELLEKSGAGLLVDVGDKEGFKEAIKKLLSNEEARKSMGLKGQELMRSKYNRNEQLKETYMSIYNKPRKGKHKNESHFLHKTNR
ncbi:MAG: glycosyltransferase family 4 protein [Candidatus Altiarchaeota archaeon]|nr:glycosyltransferase family 4 protein [Candidatus Altiarchaeota archaeon]